MQINPEESTSPRPNNRAAAMQRLIREKSLVAFKGLLELNGRDPNEVVALLTAATVPEGTEGVNVVQSAGQKYIVVLTRTFLDAEGAFVFNPQGDLLGQMGGTMDVGLAWLVNLGSPDVWFIWIDDDQGRRNEPLQTESKVFFLKPGLPLALTFDHHVNALAFTTAGSTLSGELGFAPAFGNGAGKLPLKGIGRDGKEHQALIRWDERRQIFEGPQSFKVDGQLVYTVQSQRSPAFKATDVP